MVYEIFTYGGGDYLVEVLNAVVRVMGANSFTTALRIFALFGMFSVLFDIALNGNFSKGVKYYISFLLLYNVLFVPKVDVLIIDPINQIQGDRKVDNVPFGLGFVAHTVSALGNWMTDVFGMNFVLPNDLQYNKNGILFGSTLIKDTFNARIANDRTSSNFNSYIRQCIIPAVNLKRIKTDDFLKSGSIQDFLDAGKNGVLAYDFINTGGERQINLCNDTIEITKDINAEVDKLIKQQDNTFNKNNNVNIADVNQYILGIQQSTTKMFEQSLITNAINDSTQEYLAMSGADAGATNYAITKDDMQRKTNSILQWIQAGRFLPLLKIVIEAMFYALFPIIILLTILPNGIKIFKNYILILLALQVWSPLYAILNLIMTLEQKYKISSIIAQTGNSLSLYNKQAVIDITQGIQMQAGLLAFLIPPLSFKIVQGMQNFGESMASGIASAGSYATSQVVSEVASGNLSYGNGSFKNTSYDNINAHKHDTNETYFSGVKRVQGADGIIATTTESGTTYDTTMNRSNTGVSANFGESLENSLHNAVSNSQANAKNKANTLNETITRMNNSYRENNDSTTSWGVNGKGEVSLKTSAGLKVFGNGATVEGVVSTAMQAGYDERTAKQLGNEFGLIKNQQKSYTESLNEVSNYQKSLDYVTRTGANIARDLTDEMFNKKRDNGMSESEIKSLANNRELLAKELQDYAFSKFNLDKPQMYKNHNNSSRQFQNLYDNLNFDSEHNQRITEAK